jgi:sugar O-acyltransferase (sialic acid O-acetyltransferase NeuD family)
LGAGGQGKQIIDAVERSGVYSIHGVIDSVRAPGSAFFGYPVLGDEDTLPAIAHEVAGAVVAVGDNWARAQVAARLRASVPGLSFPAIVHPSAQLARGASVGEGTVVLAGVVLNADVRIGRLCLVSPRVSIGHDSVVGDYASLGPGTVTGGNVDVGEYTAVGLGVTVIHRRTIGAHTVVGAGAVVVRDVPERGVAFGNPARVVRSREIGEQYL